MGLAIIPVLTEEIETECEQMLALCKEMRQIEPDVEVEHHKPGCGCSWIVNEETGLFELPEDYFPDDVEWVTYGTEYPFFICAHCKKLVPWCYGCDNKDEYLAACCDGCWHDLTKGGQDD